jgi:hypothetical protein
MSDVPGSHVRGLNKTEMVAAVSNAVVSDIQNEGGDDQVIVFLSFWKRPQRAIKPTLVFNFKFTTYTKLSALNQQGIRFATLRNRAMICPVKCRRLNP